MAIIVAYLCCFCCCLAFCLNHYRAVDRIIAETMQGEYDDDLIGVVKNEKQVDGKVMEEQDPKIKKSDSLTPYGHSNDKEFEERKEELRIHSL